MTSRGKTKLAFGVEPANSRYKLRLARYQALATQMEAALMRQREDGECAEHDAWIEALLVDYYDPMYDHQLRNKGDRVRFVGNRAGVRDYLLRANA